MSVVQAFRQGNRAVSAVATAAVVVVVVLAAVLGMQVRPKAAAEPLVLGQCPEINIFAGQGKTPYDQYAAVIKRNITDRFPGSVVNPVPTQGSAFNVLVLADPNAARCWLSISGMNTAVDGSMGRYQFAGQPVTTVRAVGPLWLDFIQILIREPNPADPTDRPVTEFKDLCQPGRVLETGLPSSGTERTGQVLLRQLQARVPGCQPTMENNTLAGSIDAVKNGHADALLWNSSAPTPAISDALINPQGATLTLLPLDEGYLQGMQKEWDSVYGSKVSGPVYRAAAIQRNDYPRIDSTYAIGTANQVLANDQADPDLVGFVADLLVNHRGEFERELWGANQKDRHFIDPAYEILQNPLYCFVTLHSAAATYYRDHLNITRTCPSD